jgi:hypothetical protein
MKIEAALAPQRLGMPDRRTVERKRGLDFVIVMWPNHDRSTRGRVSMTRHRPRFRASDRKGRYFYAKGASTLRCPSPDPVWVGMATTLGNNQPGFVTVAHYGGPGPTPVTTALPLRPRPSWRSGSLFPFGSPLTRAGLPVTRASSRSGRKLKRTRSKEQNYETHDGRTGAGGDVRRRWRTGLG